ncbi:MAG: hypothetical protein IPG48_15125 [Saprospiraceae bacterium]|nr:hypothetical protein [Saprospiraceae bacterium]
MGNIVTYQVKIIFNSREHEQKWFSNYNIFDTLCLLRSENSTHSYYVPFYIDDSRFEFQFGEKWSLFEGYEEDYKNRVKNRIWNADKDNCIKKIFYRSSYALDKIFSTTKDHISEIRYCRYGFDRIRFRLKEGNFPKQHELESLNIEGNFINKFGSYLTSNCRTRILGISEIVRECHNLETEYYKTITGFCRLNWEHPQNIFPTELSEDFKLFFRACETIEFFWKGRQTLEMTNQSNEKYPDSYVVRSDDYWDNVVDLEYFKELSAKNNKWNTSKLSDEDKYSC